MAKIPLAPVLSKGEFRGVRMPLMDSGALSAPGRALQGLGTELTRLAEEHRQEQDRLEDFKFRTEFERLTTEQDIALQQEADQSLDGTGLVKQRMARLSEAYSRLRPTIRDPRRQATADLMFENLKQRHIGATFSAARSRRWQWYETTIKRDANLLAVEAAGSLEALQAAWTRIEAQIAASGLPPVNKEALRAHVARFYFDRAANHNPDVASAPRPTTGMFAYVGAEQWEKANASARRKYVEGLKDYEAFLRAGNPRNEEGLYSTPDVYSRLPAVEADELETALREAEAFGADVASVRFATPDEIAALLAERQERLDSPEDFRQNAQNLQQLATAVDVRNKALVDDPAKFVQQDQEIAAKWQQVEAATEPQQLRAAINDYVGTALALQERLGLPWDAQRILSKAASAEIARRFKDQREGGQNAAQLVRQLEQQWGRHWPRVVGEVGDELPGAVLVIAAMDIAEQSKAAIQLAEAADVGRKALEQLQTEETLSDLKAAVFDEMGAFGKTLLNQPRGATTLNTFREGVYLLALSYVSQGDNPENAARRAYHNVVGMRYAMVGTYRVPVEHDSAAVSRGAERALARIETLIDVSKLDLPVSLRGLPPEDIRAAYLSNLKDSAFWVTAPDESGLVLFNETRAVVTMGNEPVFFSWEDLIRHSIVEPLPPPPFARRRMQQPEPSKPSDVPDWAKRRMGVEPTAPWPRSLLGGLRGGRRR